MKIVILDAATLGGDIDFSLFEKFGVVEIYQRTAENELAERICDTDVIIVNKIKLNRGNLSGAKKLKLICVTATGYDNIELQYCRENKIGVCNVTGYSTDSVAQLTASMALSLVMKLSSFDEYVKSGKYRESGIQNHLEPTFHEISGMTWGIVGMGNIGKRVAQITCALGAEVIVHTRTKNSDYECVGIDELCERSDIISVHVPLNEGTRCLINRSRIAKMKGSAVLINVARGAVVDERALVDAVKNGDIGGIGIDVYATEPIAEDSPYNELVGRNNVILTPHMAWGAYEARVRCIEEIAENIRV
ncbi:MAG: hydroxyacid dehydrogenase, partial [Oscillospiraceae bacterium]|nr:hydroxyacid dehydrogenase [Oscillospiraceae bacterium]